VIRSKGICKKIQKDMLVTLAVINAVKKVSILLDAWHSQKLMQNCAVIAHFRPCQMISTMLAIHLSPVTNWYDIHFSTMVSSDWDGFMPCQNVVYSFTIMSCVMSVGPQTAGHTPWVPEKVWHFYWGICPTERDVLSLLHRSGLHHLCLGAGG